jgi:glycosyltransferase involved in cell wall biosynthesis
MAAGGHVSGDDPNRIGVVHLLGGSSPGGIESFVLSLARELDRARFALSVLITDGDGPVAAELRTLGIDVVLLGRQPSSLRHWWQYGRAVRARRGAILHANLGGRALRRVAKLAGCGPMIVHAHAPPDELVPTSRATLDERRAVVQNLTDGAARVLACSDALAATLETPFPGQRPRVEVVRYGVDIAAYAGAGVARAAATLRAERKIPPSAPVVAFVGRLVPQKGIDHLAAVARTVLAERPRAHVLVAGDGPLRSHLAEIEKGPHAARCHLLGWRRDIPAIVTAADVLVVPSAWEPFGIVCIEAMAASRPVAAFAVDGIPESVIDGVTGLLAKSGDTGALAQCVLQLIDAPELRARLGRDGRARVEAHFQARFTARRLEEIYAGLSARVTT